jgi:hypothetical protein
MVKLIVSSLVVALISFCLVLGTSNIQSTGGLQNVLEVIFELVKILPLLKWVHLTTLDFTVYYHYFLFVLGSN